MIRARQRNIESKMARSVCAGMMCDQHIGAAAGNARVNRLTNSRFKLGEIARQGDRNLALFTIHRAEFHAQFYPLAIGFAAAVASHAAHVDNSAVILGEVEKSRLPSFLLPRGRRLSPVL